MRQLITIGGTGVVQASEVATASTIVERGTSGEVTGVYAIGTTALNYPGSAGGIFLKNAAKVADYTATASDGVILVNTTGANRTVTLPAAATCQYQVIEVKRTDAGEFSLTVDGNASETIDGQTSVLINGQYESAKFISDGSNWHELGRSATTSTVTKSASFSAYGANVFLVTTGAGVIVCTLPAAALMKGQRITFKKMDAGAGSITLTTNGTETIDGTNDPTLVLSGAGTQYDVLTILSDGSNWHYLADRGPAT